MTTSSAGGQTKGESVTTIYCPPTLRDLWRSENSVLPSQWHAQYPNLFDDDDLTLAQGPQRQNHFCEWFVAIHLFHRDGSRSLVEKYDTYENHQKNHLSKTHRLKVAEYERVVPEAQRLLLHEICSEYAVQLPDLMAISANGDSFSFVEVKGPGDTTLTRWDQRGSREAIRHRLKVPVEVVEVRLLP